MIKYPNIELLLNDNQVLYQLEKNSFLFLNDNFLPSGYEYRSTSRKNKYLVKNNLEYIRFSTEVAVIGKFNLFLSLPVITGNKNITFPFDLYTTLSPIDVRTKFSALLLAYYSGIIDDFFGEKFTLTHTGNLPIDSFSFFIESPNNNKVNISLRNFSGFIDGVFESPNKVVLISNELYKTEDISLKDLFLAYSYYNSRTAKEICIAHMSFSNDIFSLYEIRFRDINHINNAIIGNVDSYKITNDKINYSDIVNCLKEVVIIDEKEVPFPQANDFEKIIDLINLLNNSEFSINEIANYFQFVDRQAHYYVDAGIYLNLIEVEVVENTKKYKLTNKAKEIVNSRLKPKYINLVKCIVEHEVFNETLSKYVSSNTIPSIEEIVKVMRESNIYNVNSDSTFIRRASTVQSWIKWIIELPKIYY